MGSVLRLRLRAGVGSGRILRTPAPTPTSTKQSTPADSNSGLNSDFAALKEIVLNYFRRAVAPTPIPDRISRTGFCSNLSNGPPISLFIGPPKQSLQSGSPPESSRIGDLSAVVRTGQAARWMSDTAILRAAAALFPPAIIPFAPRQLISPAAGLRIQAKDEFLQSPAQISEF